MVDFDNQNRKRCRHCKMIYPSRQAMSGRHFARAAATGRSICTVAGLRSGTAEVQRQTTGDLQEG